MWVDVLMPTCGMFASALTLCMRGQKRFFTLLRSRGPQIVLPSQATSYPSPPATPTFATYPTVLMSRLNVSTMPPGTQGKCK